MTCASQSLQSVSLSVSQFVHLAVEMLLLTVWDYQ